MKTAITPTRKEDYPQWYQQVITHAELAEVAPVRGCMVIKPWGYALWEGMQKILDQAIKATGHQNIYCPLFIPLSFLEKEAEHVAGFAKECAVVTHSRLVQDDAGKLTPASPLDAPLVVRPTSETMIGALFAKWIQSYRDLPMKLNQWANIVRWEMRTRLFLRTSEFLWQEGHTAHETQEEANAHALKMLDMYYDFCINKLAICAVKGEKSKNERFPGAINTYTFEALMQDNKALQMGTSHYLGQNFAKGSDIRYQDRQGDMQYVHTTSWGVTTRMIGALIMSHSDDNGLVLPPAIAPYQIVILPILAKNADNTETLNYVAQLADALRALSFSGESLRVHIDDRDRSGGEKSWSWVKKGVPIRLEIGARECAENTVCLRKRTEDYKDKHLLNRSDLLHTIVSDLTTLQAQLLDRSRERLLANCTLCLDPESLDATLRANKMAAVYWYEDDAIEAMLAERHSATIRAFVAEDNPFAWDLTSSACFDSSKSGRLALIAKAY